MKGLKLTRKDVLELIERGLKVYDFAPGCSRRFLFLTDSVLHFDDAVYTMKSTSSIKGTQPLPAAARSVLRKRMRAAQQ
jgi:hypothetical protein